MGASARERAVQFSWENITAKVEDYYRFVARRAAAQGHLPPHTNPSLISGPREPLPINSFRVAG